jgi:hypothetical protein
MSIHLFTPVCIDIYLSLFSLVAEAAELLVPGCALDGQVLPVLESQTGGCTGGEREKQCGAMALEFGAAEKGVQRVHIFHTIFVYVWDCITISLLA